MEREIAKAHSKCADSELYRWNTMVVVIDQEEREFRLFYSRGGGHSILFKLNLMSNSKKLMHEF